jgi:hypothetical protein
MNIERHYGRDLTYSLAHRTALPELYGRIGHRTGAVDRDWTERCFHCRKGLALIEEVRDVGQNLADKSTTMTRELATVTRWPAFLVAWRNDRPPDVQVEIDTLNRRLRELEAAYPITGFKVRRVPGGKLTDCTPQQWWETILILHGDHYATCSSAYGDWGRPVDEQRLHELKAGNPIWPEALGTQILTPTRMGWGA